MIKILRKGIHQSWGVVAMCAGVILGCILGVVFRINSFSSFWWVVFMVVLFVFMYLKPKVWIIFLCIFAGVGLSLFRISNVYNSGGQVELGVDEGTENLVIGARDWFGGRISETLPKKEASLGMSYLLGMKTNLDKELSENLKVVGLAHIVVASGAHLSILVEIARKIFGKISRFSGLLFSILFILFFMMMVGWTSSILRAGVMAILTITFWYVGRKTAPIRLILMVAAFTLILNPLFLTDLGWLLSFASYSGIMILGPMLTKFFYGEKKPGFVASVVLTTIAATLMTLPITLYYFGQISLIFLVANLLILPTLPYAMGMTFFAGVFAGVPGLSNAVGFLTEKLLDFHIAVVECFASMEQFLIRIERYEPRVFLLYLVILVPILGLIVRKMKKHQR